MSKQKKNNVKKFANNKVNTTRTNRNKRKYVTVNKKKSYSPLFLFIFFLSILGNVFLVGHYITFDHNKVKIETKEVIKPSPNYLFLGDSITEMYDLEKYFPDDPVVNSGVSGDATHDILEDMEKRVYQYNPSKVFLLIGTNDLAQEKSPEEIFDNIKEMIERIQENRPEAEIYIESVYPVNETLDTEMVGKRKNEDIRSLNDLLQNYCQEEDLVYIDVYEELIDANGQLTEEYTKEGLHLNENGYQVVTDILKEYIES